MNTPRLDAEQVARLPVLGFALSACLWAALYLAARSAFS